MVRHLLMTRKKQGTLIVIACHDREEMRLLADEVLVMAEGKLIRRESVGQATIG